MKKYGDPLRRSADHGEAYGASIKDGIHRRTLRRKKGTEKQKHKRRDRDGNIVKEWEQKALGVSRVMQVWRDMVVRNKLLEDPASEAYLQRVHARTQDTGYARVAASTGPRQMAASVFEKVKESLDNA